MFKIRISCDKKIVRIYPTKINAIVLAHVVIDFTGSIENKLLNNQSIKVTEKVSKNALVDLVSGPRR